MPSADSRGCSTTSAWVRLARSLTRSRSPGCGHLGEHTQRRRTGARARWPTSSGSATARFASGGRSGSSRTVRKPSNSPPTPCSLRDVVGLSMNPPDNAVVLCVEKSQIQALAAAASWASRAGHARVPTQRDDDALRGPGQHWQRHRQVLCPPPRGRVRKPMRSAETQLVHIIVDNTRRTAPRPSSGGWPTTRGSTSTSSPPTPLAQPSGRLVQHPDDQTDQARFAQKRRATEDGYRRVPRRMERKPHTVQMD